MKWTTERCVPDDMFEFPWVYTYHLMLYAFAVQFCSKKDVLDVSCGTGYGMQMMAPVCKSVSGGDICEETLEYARNYNTKNAVLKQIDLAKESIVDVFGRKFDVITCFQSIEHFEDPEFFLHSVYEALIDEGLFVLSIPIHSVTPYHKIIFSYGQALLIGDDEFVADRIIVYRGDGFLDRKFITDEAKVASKLNSNGTTIVKVMRKKNGNFSRNIRKDS